MRRLGLKVEVEEGEQSPLDRVLVARALFLPLLREVRPPVHQVQHGT